MGKDILTRLQTSQRRNCACRGCTDARDAATEIKRLRKELDIYKDLYAAEAVSNV